VNVNAGTLTLSGSGTLGATNGALTIGAGTVNLGGLSRTNGAFTLDTGTLTNGTLAATSYALTNAGTISANLAGTGALTKSGSGTATLSGANTYSGGTTVSGGTLAGNTGSLIGNITNNATVEFGQATAGTYSNVISGSGAFRKSGVGELTLNNANTYSGGTTVTQGTLKLNRAGNGTGGTIVGTIAVNGGTLLLGQANQISDSSAINLGGGTINTGGFADRTGQLTVSANSAISGLVTSSGGGVPASNDFLFSSVSLTNYATSSGSTLDLGSGYGYKATINFASSNYTGWTGYSSASINNFADKVQFGNTGLKAQINFNGTTGLTYITAIPEPKVYVAMAMLVALVGVTEYRRRRNAKSAAA
jgi:autotransporter-associated beta strand protein